MDVEIMNHDVRTQEGHNGVRGSPGQPGENSVDRERNFRLTTQNSYHVEQKNETRDAQVKYLRFFVILKFPIISTPKNE